MKTERNRHVTWLASLLLLSTFCLVPGTPALAADETKKDQEIPEWGRVGLQFRYRFETVSDDNFVKNAKASTLRTALNYHTASVLGGLNAFFEFEDVTDLGLKNDHNNDPSMGPLWNGVLDRPVIADPAGTDINQAFGRYRGLKNADFLFGRQEMQIHEERFIGAVGWRQNHQSFDSFRFHYNVGDTAKVFYAYLRGQDTVTGRLNEMSSHVANSTIDVTQRGRLTPYLYYLDFDQDLPSNFSTASLGVRWQDRQSPGGGWTLPYHAELALQRDVGRNPNNVEAYYLRLELAPRKGKVALKGGLEILGATKNKGRFTTPLATLFKWNGWADRFLVTPVNGLRDLYVGGVYTAGSFACTLMLHDFRSDVGSQRYGWEVDFLAKYTAPWKQAFYLRYANYQTRGFSEDVNKAWIYTVYNFSKGIS